MSKQCDCKDGVDCTECGTTLYPEQAQIVVNITPVPLDSSAYYLSKTLNSRELAAFSKAWRKMEEESGTRRCVIVIPEGTELREIPTPALKELRKAIDESLKERGES